ncbi:hypothetical protein SLEP1_g9470 [Rubroshorea leprosula]|uniref:Uncharacterized protein n=1 Tax=Rubroshorea leprosula TaxID=152421 RepID=A0AAV5IB06_9ROSI|nr:hypothetical protein SLEP1_g9470 [Rubroshorea leprosula]
MVVSINKNTDKYRVYKLEIPNVDGVDCVEGLVIESICHASLIGSSSSPYNLPALKTSINQMLVKAKQENLCIYSLNVLSYKPSKRNVTLCGNHKEKLPNSLETSKCFLPFFPPHGFLWPFHSFPFPSLPPHSLLPSRPFSYPYNPPSLPFPFPPTSSLSSHIPHHEFNLGDPKTWIPSFPPPPPSSAEDLKP